MRTWLKVIRIKRGLKQSEVADAAGIKQPTYFSIESGKTDPRLDTARNIAKVLDFDPCLFFSNGQEVIRGERSIV